MRILFDYLYANSLIGLLTTFGGIAAVLLVLFLAQRADFDRKKSPWKLYLFWMIYIACGLFFVVLIVQLGCNPFAVGRAGVIHQAAVLNNSIVFTDSYAQFGMEFGDTPPMIRVWVIDRKTGKLLKRKKVDSYELIVAAGENSMLIHEDDNWYIADDKFNVATNLITTAKHEGKKVHEALFSDGILKISYKDLSVRSMALPFSRYVKNAGANIKLKFLDADRETYQVSCCGGPNMRWERNQTIGALLKYVPEMIYESPSGDLYLLWTEKGLVALSKRTGETAWSLEY